MNPWRNIATASARSRWRAFLAVLAAGLFLSVSARAEEVGTETTTIQSDYRGLGLALHHESPRSPASSNSGRVVLFAEGSAVPTSGNAAFRIDGLSWMDQLAQSGFDVWSLDYLGLGASDRYPPGPSHAAVGRAADCAAQLASAARFIAARQKVTRIALIGDSFGSLPAGILAAQSPELIEKLVLFGAVVPVAKPAAEQRKEPPPPRYVLVTPRDIWDVYSSWLPPGQSAGLDRAFFLGNWGTRYIASDPGARSRTPPSVQVPNGTAFDDLEIEKGNFPYDPGSIRSPTLVINGEWDDVTTDAGAARLFAALTAAKFKRRVVIGRSTHIIQLEPARFQLYREVETFLTTDAGS